MTALSSPGRRLDRWRIVVCAALLLFVLVQYAVIVSSIPLFYQRIAQGLVPTIVAAGRDQTSNALITARAALRGFSPSEYAVYFLVLNVGIALGFWSAAGLVLWKARNDWFRWFTALVLVFFPGGTMWQITVVTQVGYVFLTFGSVLWPAFALFLYLFPTGRAVPRWSRWPMAVYVVLHFLLQLAGAMVNVPGLPLAWLDRLAAPWIDQVALAVTLVFPFVLGCQVYRYRRVAGPVERKQLQWFVAGLAAYIVVLLIILVGAGGVRVVDDLGFAGDLGNLLALIIPAAITVSILRYRLWDIDVLIRRTLVYAVLTAVLALAYFGSVLVLESVFRALTGQGQNSLVVVLSTLAIAVLVVPLRRRVQRAIDRRFFRQKYDAARTLAGFAVTARDEVDLDRLSAQLVAVVQDSMQPEQVSLWLRKGKGA